MKGKIFNAQEVQSILNGSKVMFREVIKTPIYWRDDKNSYFFGKEKMSGYPFQWTDKCPYQVGQKIFVKEAFCESIFGKAIYRDGANQIRGFGGKEVVIKWKPAQHMKQEHSRLTLLIKSIGVERLSDISEEDAISEGLFADSAVYYDGANGKTATEKFILNWNATHKKPEEKFEANPWVWCVTFDKLIID